MVRKQRRGPALFELLSDDKTKPSDLLIPPGFRVVGTDADESAESPGLSRRGADGSELLQTDPLRGTASGQHAAEGVSGVLSVDGERLRVTLTPVTAAAAVCVFCLILVAVFAIGRRQGDQVGFARGFAGNGGSTNAVELSVDEVGAARSQQPATHIVSNLVEGSRIAPETAVVAAKMLPNRAAPAASAEGAKASLDSTWVPDHTYIVAQEFSSGREEDALRAQRFLAERGIGTAVVRLDGGAIQLITVQGYNHKEPDQKKLADEWLKKQRAAGLDYFGSGGGYKLEGYYKTFKRDRW